MNEAPVNADELKLYALLRTDISMSPGKCCAQAGHAFIGALLESQSVSPSLYQSYSSQSVSTKICLDGGSEASLLLIFERLKADGYPCRLIVDSGHVELPYFDGRPVVTALGAGPFTPSSVPRYLKKLRLFGAHYGRTAAM